MVFRLEDGTISYAAIASLKFGFEALDTYSSGKFVFLSLCDELKVFSYFEWNANKSTYELRSWDLRNNFSFCVFLYVGPDEPLGIEDEKLPNFDEFCSISITKSSKPQDLDVY